MIKIFSPAILYPEKTTVYVSCWSCFNIPSVHMCVYRIFKNCIIIKQHVIFSEQLFCSRHYSRHFMYVNAFILKAVFQIWRLKQKSQATCLKTPR